MPYRVVIVEDHPLIASSLKTILMGEDDVMEVEIYSSIDNVIAAHKKNPFHGGLIDINLGGEDGRDLVKIMTRSAPDFKSIFLSSHDHPRIIKTAFQAGAKAYLLKSCDKSEISACFDAVFRKNRQYITRDVQAIVNDFIPSETTSNHNFPELTSREKEVLQLIAEEYTTKEIAERLHLSIFTIEGHRANLFQKFEVKNLAGLIKKAIYAGLID